MTLAELDAFLAEEKAKRANAAKPIMDVAPLALGQHEAPLIEEREKEERGAFDDGDPPPIVGPAAIKADPAPGGAARPIARQGPWSPDKV